MKIYNIEPDLSNTSCPTPRIICIRVDTSLSGTRKKFELLSLKSTLQIMSVFSVLVNRIVVVSKKGQDRYLNKGLVQYSRGKAGSLIDPVFGNTNTN
jgi:hypothetical protein